MLRKCLLSSLTVVPKVHQIFRGFLLALSFLTFRALMFESFIQKQNKTKQKNANPNAAWLAFCDLANTDFQVKEKSQENCQIKQKQ